MGAGSRLCPATIEERPEAPGEAGLLGEAVTARGTADDLATLRDGAARAAALPLRVELGPAERAPLGPLHERGHGLDVEAPHEEVHHRADRHREGQDEG